MFGAEIKIMSCVNGKKYENFIYFSPEQFPLLLQLLTREQSKFSHLVPEYPVLQLQVFGPFQRNC